MRNSRKELVFTMKEKISADSIKNKKQNVLSVKENEKK